MGHEMMQMGDAPMDNEIDEWGWEGIEDDSLILITSEGEVTNMENEIEMWDTIVRQDVGEKCDKCSRSVSITYPVYCEEVDPTNPTYRWCRVCINEQAQPLPFELSDDLPF